MSDYFLGLRSLTDGAIGEMHDAQKVPLGTRLCDNEGNIYIYLKGVANTATGSWVAYDKNKQTSLLTDTIAGKLYPIAIATAAITADYYGWYMIAGDSYQGNVLANCAAESLLYATSTPGYLDDSGTIKVIGAIATTARGSTNGLTDMILNYPNPQA